MSGHLVDGALEMAALEGLAHASVGADPARRLVGIHGGRKEEDRERAQVGVVADGGHQAREVEARHLHILEDDVRSLGPDGLEDGRGGLHGDDVVAERLEQERRAAQDVGVVVGDEDTDQAEPPPLDAAGAGPTGRCAGPTCRPRRRGRREAPSGTNQKDRDGTAPSARCGWEEGAGGGMAGTVGEREGVRAFLGSDGL